MPIKRETVKIWVFTCSRCGHRWTPRKPLEIEAEPEPPKKCAGCLSNLWNEPRVRAEPKRKK